MNPGSLQIRRATVDDLPALKTLWSNAQLPVGDLENRLTEFQVVEKDGSFAGAIGVQILRQHLRFYAEDYTDFSVADAARELFWNRIQKIASNHGVFRVWTLETSPFWTRWGFQSANDEILGRLPEEWKALEGRWLTLELKNEDVIRDALENKFAGFMDAEKQQTERIADKARTLRLIITIAGFAVFFLCLVVAFFLLTRHPLQPR